MNLLEDKEGQENLLLGNEAVVRGALEAGVDIIAQYPGTPSSEIGDTFWRYREGADYYYEYSTNEKVALEVAAAAAASGLRSLTAMKHVGLNVAADSFMSTAYVGVRGGMVIVTADDPSVHSSQNEQDNRVYARLANMPLLEPATPGQAKEFTKRAFELSEELEMPILLRLTTRVSHTRGLVSFGRRKKGKGKSVFVKEPSRFVPIPANSYRMHAEVLEKLERAEQISSESSDLNRVFPGEGAVGIIASGVGAAYAKEAISGVTQQVPLLTLGFSYPLPTAAIKGFLTKYNLKKVLIVEELEPLVEDGIRSLLYGTGIEVEILGKRTGHFSRAYEYTPGMVKEALAKTLGVQITKNGPASQPKLKMPPRPPELCPGCSHRHSYYAAVRAGKRYARVYKTEPPIFTTDIGCYTLGYGSPFETADYLLSMGSSMGTAGGFARATDQPVIAFIGDSTFYHSGIPGLINNVYHGHNVTLVILDNRTTAMTGHQPNPGVVVSGESSFHELSLEKLVGGLGVEFVEVGDPAHLKETEELLYDAIAFEGPSVVILRSPCILMENRAKRKAGIKIPSYTVLADQCTGCNICINTLACPAFYRQDGKIAIDADLCAGCGVCTQVCPFGAIVEVS